MKKLEGDKLLKELEKETKKAKKSTITVSNNTDPLYVDASNVPFLPPIERFAYKHKQNKYTNLLQKALTLFAIIISLGLMVAGVKVVLQNSDQTGAAVVMTVLLAYCIVVNVKRFIK